ncbi:hypothetical protein H2203_004472 [Taxawa tesnikishii (nom. ined.)]|nr:hypothetical protein H2203_004472 [Dothideales sp. JES 119]
MAAAIKKKIVVAGGNGFLGKKPDMQGSSRQGLGRNIDQIISYSRSGEPNWSSVTSSSTPPPWSSSVRWHSANVLQPSTYRDVLSGADAVVHTMGILLEADYKGVLTGKEPLIKGLQKAFASTKKGTQNPLDRKEGEDVEPLEEGGQITYEVMNRDSAILLAKESNSASVSSFVYISAAGGAPVLPQRYIATKRAAESTIIKEFPDMRSVFLRPGFLYDSSRSFTVPMAGLTFMGAMANSLSGGRLTSLMGAGGVKPLQADLVGEAVVEAIADDKMRGFAEVSDIEALASKSWRRGML